MFPSLVSFEISVNNSGKIEYVMLECKTNYQYGCIVPFAQRDVIDAFFTGSSVIVRDVLVDYLAHFFKAYTELIIKLVESNNNLDELSRNSLITDLKNIKVSKEFIEMGLNDFFDDLEGVIMVPMLSSINSMPKQELIEMANSLINITSLRRKMDFDVESVCGDIAVAIITKGDGFVWVNNVNKYI